MRNLVLVSLTIVLGCGGGGGSKTTDPASLDFCLAWANGVCRLAYLCVDIASQDAAFHARYGASSDNCFQSLESLCTSNQTGTQTFGPSCGPGKTVNQTAATTCTNNLDSESCVDWTAGQAGGCEGVCGATTGADAGTGSDAATTGLGTAVGFCNTEGSLLCDRSFECDPAGSATQFGNLAGCKATLSSLCSSGQPCPNGYNQSSASGCIAATQAASCQDLMGSTPAVCTSACP